MGTHPNGAVLGCALHGLKAQGYVRTPFHGGRVAGWRTREAVFLLHHGAIG